MAMRDQGLVNQVFDEQKLRALQGDMAVGHVRYSTTGANSWENSQPVWRADRREVALAHNGNLINAVELHGELREQGVAFRSTSDSEIIAALLSTHEADTIEDAVADVIGRARGRLLDRRDDQGPRRRLPRPGRPAAAVARHARRPLLRRVGDLRVRHHRRQASCATSSRARSSRSPSSGLADAPGGRRRERRALCVFEHIYFARPDSRLGGQVLQVARGRMGEILAREAPVDADLVIPVPDSGNPAARGYARASGLPQDDGFVKNRYVARTFIQPGQELRKHGLRLKFNPLPEVVAGKRLVVVDDSIVRGNTTRQIVQMLRDAGAREVHMRISAPPIRHPCHYGIDMSTREEMIAHGRTEAEVAAELGADSLAYLSLDGRLRGDRRHARHALRRLLLGRLPAREHRTAQRKDAFELAARARLTAGCSLGRPESTIGRQPMSSSRKRRARPGTRRRRARSCATTRPARRIAIASQRRGRHGSRRVSIRSRSASARPRRRRAAAPARSAVAEQRPRAGPARCRGLDAVAQRCRPPPAASRGAEIRPRVDAAAAAESALTSRPPSRGRRCEAVGVAVARAVAADAGRAGQGDRVRAAARARASRCRALAR